MANYLVSTSGHFIQYNLLVNAGANFDIEFNPEDFNIIFDDVTGRVLSFVLNDEHYSAVYDKNTREPKGYYPTIDFFNKKANAKDFDKSGVVVAGDEVLFRPVNAGKNGVFQLPNSGETVLYNPEEDRIFLVRRSIIFDETQQKYLIKIHHKSFKYIYGALFDSENFDAVDANYFGADNFIDSSPSLPPIQFIDSRFATYAKDITDRNYLNNEGVLVQFSEQSKNTIENIALIFDALYREPKFLSLIGLYNLEYIFDKHFEIINDPNFSVINEDEYYSEFTKEYFINFRFRLLRFLYWAKTNYISDESKLRILGIIYGLFTNSTLNHLDYETEKLPVFKEAINNLWVSGRWWFANVSFKLTEEELIVKIINSIPKIDATTGLPNYDNINHFMDLLATTPNFFQGIYDWFKVKIYGDPTLFQILYMDVDDAILFGDDGKGAKGQLMNSVYRLWLNSKYNPENETLFPSFVLPYNYTSYNAYWKLDDDDEVDQIDDTASPNLINYESDRILLWYKDNFNFPFIGHKIVALEERQISFTAIVMSLLQTEISPFNNLDIEDILKYVPFGYYHIFQPVSIRNTDALDTIIKIPFNGNLANPCDISTDNADKNTNSIPIFYLKYVDDLGDYSDFKETIGTVTDVVLTFSGIGNITKVRHLAKASVIRRFLFEGIAVVSPIERAALIRTLKFAFATWEIALGTASVFHNIFNAGCNNYDPCNPPQEGTPEYDQFQRCKAIDVWLFALEILTMSGDYLAKRYFKNKSRDLRAIYTDQEIDNIPQQRFDELPNETPMDKPQLKSAMDLIIDSAAEYSEWVNNVLRQNGYNDLADKLDLLIPEKRYGFMSDYKTQAEAWDALNTNTNLVDTWDLMTQATTNLPSLRKNPDVLRNLEDFSGNLDFEGTDLLESFAHEVNHLERGTALRQLIAENPDDIQDIMRPILLDPAASFANRNLDARWKKWRKTPFAKLKWGNGNTHEINVNRVLKNQNLTSSEYMMIKNSIALSPVNKSIADYEFFNQVQLIYDNSVIPPKYFIADQLLIKYDIDINDGEKFISDIIIIESKLQATTALSINQREAILAAFTDPNFQGFKVRNKVGKKSAAYNKKNKLDSTWNINYEGELSIFKVSDTDDGSVITEVERLTNLNI